MESFEHFKLLALWICEQLYLIDLTEEQFKDAYEIFLDQPNQDPTGDRILWAEQSLMEVGAMQMETVKYLNKKYPTRTLAVKHEYTDECVVTYMIAPESLIDAIREVEGDDDLEIDSEGGLIDSEIYHYVEDKYFSTTPEEICSKHLDIPMEFIGEDGLH